MEGGKEEFKSLVSDDPGPASSPPRAQGRQTEDTTDGQMAEARDGQMGRCSHRRLAPGSASCNASSPGSG